MTKQPTVSRAESSLSSEAKAALRALGLSLRAARTAKHITRQELAGRLLIGTHTLHRIEIGDPRVSMGYYLATAEHLEVPLLDTKGLLSVTSALGHAGSRARRKRAADDRFR